MRFTLILILLTILPIKSFSADFWLPLTVGVTASGALQHTLPIPTPSNIGGSGFEGGFASFKASSHSFSPIISGSYNKADRVFALTKNSQDVNKYVRGKGGFFVPANPVNGYLLSREVQGSLEIGLGATVGPIGWGLLGVSASLSGSYSSSYSFTRKFKTKEDIKSFKGGVSLPVTKEGIKSDWPLGGSISTARVIALNIGLGLGAGPLTVGGVASFYGTWEVSVEIPSLKKNPNQTLVKVTYKKIKGKKYSIGLSAMVTGVEAQKVFENGKSVSYLFDLNNIKKHTLKVPKNLTVKDRSFRTISGLTTTDIYQYVLQGDLVYAEILSKVNNSLGVNGVTKVSSSHFFEKKTGVEEKTTIPFLFSKNSFVGKTLVVNSDMNLKNNLVLKNIIGVSNDTTTSSGLLSDDLNRSSTFFGNIQEIEHKNPRNNITHRRYNSNYNYFFTMNNATVQDVHDELKRIRYKLGLMKNLKQLIPHNENAKEEKIGSVQISLDILFSKQATDLIMDKAASQSLSQHKFETRSYIEGFFENVEKPEDELKCTFKVGCMERTISRSEKAIEKAYNALNKMVLFRNDKNYEEFAKEFSNFGSVFVRNRFVSKTILRLMRYKCLPSVYISLVKQKTTKSELEKICPSNKSKFPYEIVLNYSSTAHAPRQYTIIKAKD